MGHPCPNCGLEREFSAALAGLRVGCRGCSHFFDLPKAGRPAEPVSRFTVPRAVEPAPATTGETPGAVGRPITSPLTASPSLAPPAAIVTIDTGPELASRFIRLAARVIDTILLVGMMLAGMFAGALLYPVDDENELTGAVLQDSRSSVASAGLLALTVVFVLNVILLSVRGQSVGKWLLRIRIVRDSDNERVGFLRGFLLRDGVTLLIKLAPFVGTIYVWIDSLFIFNAERRCLHDFIAGTRVVQVQPEGHADFPAE